MRLTTAKQEEVLQTYDAIHAELKALADLNSRAEEKRDRIAALRSQLARIHAECREEMLCSEVA